MYKDDGDAKLMAGLANGDNACLGELYLRHGGAVRSFVWRLLPGAQANEAEDLCQEAFVTLQRTAKRYQSDERLRPWIFGIAANIARAWRRKQWSRQMLFLQYIKQQRSQIPDYQTERLEHRQRLEQVMASLSQGQREVIILHLGEGMATEEVASVLGVSQKTVWTRLHRARKLLQQRLKEIDRTATRDGL